VELAGVIAFVVLALAAAGVGFYSNSLSNGRRKGSSRFLAASLFAAGLCAMGLLNLIGIHTSRRSWTSGIMGGLKQSHGRSSSSSFYVFGPDRRWRYVHCDYAGDHLADGETVSVEVLKFHSTLLHLTIVNGPYAGWDLTEGDGTVTSSFIVGIGLFVILGARAKWRRDPEAFEETKSGQAPLDGVDSESLLHLSKPDK